MTTTPPQGRLKEKLVKKALKTLDWVEFETHLATIELDDAEASDLIGHIRRDSKFLIKRPDPGRQVSRAAFLASLGGYLKDNVGEAAAVQLYDLVALIGVIEDGYHSVMAAQAKTDAAKLAPDTQVSAAFARSAFSYHDLKRMEGEQLGQKQEFSPQSFMLTLEDGSEWPPDALLSSMVDAATATLMMLGHRNGWFVDDYLTLPEPVETSEGERFKTGATEALAAWWGQWERLEQRCRYFGGDITVHGKDALPAWSSSKAGRAIEYGEFTETELFDLVANQRLSERMIQTFHEMSVQTNIQAKASGIDVAVDLAPKSYVSDIEAHACVMLSQTLGYSVVDDVARAGGLRLVEWIRGYAALRCLAEARYERDGMEGLTFTQSRSSLLHVLGRVGLTAEAAETFIDNVSLRTSSRDLFDQPLVRIGDHALLLFGPGVLDADPGRVTLSAIGNIGEQLKRKGKAFEADMMRYFKGIGFDAKSFKFKVGGEEFEYDLVIPWDDYIFVCECKNHSLSGNSPVQAYYFRHEIDAAVRQVTRLARGMVQHAAIIQERFGVDIVGKTIVPCVLNSLPYALPGDHDGVYVTDASSLTRFFNRRHFHAIRPRFASDGGTVEDRTVLETLWASDKPTPADLLRYLADPLQLKVMLARAQIRPHLFGLDGQTVVCVQRLHLTEITTSSIAQIFSGQTASAEAIDDPVG